MRSINFSKLSSIRRHVVGGQKAFPPFLNSASSRHWSTPTSSYMMTNCNFRFHSSKGASLFHDDRISLAKEDNDLDKQLRSDVKTMGSILGKLRQHCPQIMGMHEPQVECGLIRLLSF